MKDKVEIGLIRCGEIAMYLRKYAELIEIIDRHYHVTYAGHADAIRPMELANELRKEGYAIEKALWESEHEGETYPLPME